MEGKVPGGRQKSATMEDFTADDDDECAYDTGKLSPEHRHVSQSLPKFSETRKHDSLPDNLEKSQTLDRRRKSRSPSIKASFGNFVQKVVRHMSGRGSQSTRPPKLKQRSLSVGAKHSRRQLQLSRTSKRAATTSHGHRHTDFVPGLIGLHNHGNTCFMNAVLQCLCHTEILAEYFVTDQYKYDIKRNNKLNAKHYGTRGELTEQLGYLFKSLWSSKYGAEISSDFKTVVGKYAAQYRGFQQHDAQEFLLWLLDKVHEDLNIATKKKYRPNKSSHGRTDEAVAAEALANHMRCNNSFVYDLFQALYRSSLTCPNCRRHSNTFDPFLSVSLPIPQKTQRPVYVTVVYLDAQPKQVRIGLLLNQTDTVRELRQTLANDTKIPESRLVLTEIYCDGFHRTFQDSQPLSEIHENDNVYAIEIPHEKTGPNSEEVHRYVTLLVLNIQVIGQQTHRFCCPVAIQVPRDTNFADLQGDIFDRMTRSMRDGTCMQKSGSLSKLHVVDFLPDMCVLPSDVEHPLYMPSVDQVLSNTFPGAGPQHLKLIAEWDLQTKKGAAVGEDYVEEHTSVQQVQLAYQQPVLGTLDECFRLYTQEEKLGEDNAWLCPNCRCRQQGTLKSLSLWSLPDILVVHLKRFKQIGMKRIKLNTLITFPIQGLDMSHHVTKRHHQQQTTSTSNSSWSPWRRSKQAEAGPDENIYDLYAVCNHYGNMQGGHYTAFALNAANKKWYIFDDTEVKETNEDQIVTRAAYLLFYARRSVLTNCEQNNYWMYEATDIPLHAPHISKSHHDLLAEDDLGISLEAADLSCDVSFSRSVQAYATLRTPSKSRCVVSGDGSVERHGIMSREGSLERHHGVMSRRGSFDGSHRHLPGSQSSGQIIETSNWSPSINSRMVRSPSLGSATLPHPSTTKGSRSRSRDISPVIGMHPAMIHTSSIASQSSTPTHDSHSGTPNTTLSRCGTPSASLSRSNTPVEKSSPSITPSNTLSRSGTPSSSIADSHKLGAAVRPAHVAGISGIYRGTFSSASSTPSRKYHSLGRNASLGSYHHTAASQPGTPTTSASKMPGTGMIRSASMNSSTPSWAYATSSICMKESCV